MALTILIWRHEAFKEEENKQEYKSKDADNQLTIGKMLRNLLTFGPMRKQLFALLPTDIIIKDKMTYSHALKGRVSN